MSEMRLGAQLPAGVGRAFPSGYGSAVAPRSRPSASRSAHPPSSMASPFSLVNSGMAPPVHLHPFGVRTGGTGRLGTTCSGQVVDGSEPDGCLVPDDRRHIHDLGYEPQLRAARAVCVPEPVLRF